MHAHHRNGTGRRLKPHGLESDLGRFLIQVFEKQGGVHPLPIHGHHRIENLFGAIEIGHDVRHVRLGDQAHANPGDHAKQPFGAYEKFGGLDAGRLAGRLGSGLRISPVGRTTSIPST